MRRLREIAGGLLVATAEMYLTNSVVVAGSGGGCLVVDPAVTVEDLGGLVADLADVGLRPVAGFATHPHWDHILWSRHLGDVPRYASSAAVAVAAHERPRLLEAVQKEAPGHDVGLFGRLTGLGPAQNAIAWDGPEAVAVTHAGHAPGHSALFLPGAGTLIAGDMCSDAEIPLLDTSQPDPVGDYRAGLRRLAALPVRTVVPGHGHVGDAAEFRRRVAADNAYLDDLEQGVQATDPRLSAEWLRAEHVRQAKRVRS